MRRRDFLKCMGAGLCTASAGAYAAYFDPRWLEYTQKAALLPGAVQPLRLLHLSDLHASPSVPLDIIAQALDLGLAHKPDLICLTGDYVTGRLDDLEGYRRILERLPHAGPAYAVLGNHDGGIWAGERGGYANTRGIMRLLEDSGIHLLHNRSELLQLSGRELRIVGVGDGWAGAFDARSAFAGLPPHEPRVVLCHNPDFKEPLAEYGWQLMLSGHTHGGQIRVPFLHAAPFAPVRDKRFVDGLYDWEGRRLHITRGVGSYMGIRAFCRPEVSMLLV